MTTLDKIENWGNAHRIAALDYVRIVVGVFITYKGFSFMLNMEVLYALTGDMDLMFATAAISHYVVFFHALGGPLIVLGIYTRVVSALQVPILLGAIFLVNHPQGFLSMGDHMELEGFYYYFNSNYFTHDFRCWQIVNRRNTKDTKGETTALNSSLINPKVLRMIL